MHVDEEQVQRLLHGELAEPARATIGRHLADCALCAARVNEAKSEERWLLDVLTATDHEMPVVAPEDTVRRSPRRSWTWRSTRRVAVAFLAVGLATAAYALPGSPLPLWVRRVSQWIVGETARTPVNPRVPTDSTIAAGSAGAGSGISLPADDRLTIRFQAPQLTGTATLRLTDSASVLVRVLRRRASFTMGGEYLTIDNTQSPGDYAIEVPRQAQRVEVRVGDNWVLTVEDSRVTTRPDVEREPGGALRFRLGVVRR